MNNESPVDASAAAMLFAAATVDDAWLETFRARLDADPRWLDVCERVVAARYASDAAARDGHSRIGWALGRLEQTERALAHYARDFEVDRMGRWQFFHYLEQLVAVGRIEDASCIVAEFTRRRPDVADTWVRVAWRHHAAMDHAKARETYRYDFDRGRLSPKWVLRLAEVEARLGHWDAAERLIAEAYRADPALVDGFVRLGMLCLERNDRVEALRWLRHDREHARISPGMKLLLAETAAAGGEWEQAEAWVEEVYRHDGAARDGFGRLGRAKMRIGDPAQAIGYFERDAAMSRMTDSFAVFHAQALAELLHFSAAEAVIDRAYAGDPALRDGNVAVGLWIEKRFFDRARSFLHRDRLLGRITPSSLLHLAEMDDRVGREVEAEQWIAQAYAADESLRDGHVPMARRKSRRQEWPEALALAARDEAMGRLSDAARAEVARWKARG